MKLLPCTAQIRCTQRSCINSNLTCIWSQFDRGSRPRAEATAVCMPEKGPAATLWGLRDSSTLSGLHTHSPAAGAAVLLTQLASRLLHTDLPWSVLTPLRVVLLHCKLWDCHGPQVTVPRGQGRCLRHLACSGHCHSLPMFLCFS